jgi:hypothetical protein
VSDKLRRFWFRFTADNRSSLAYGVTAWTEEDARAILRAEVFGGDLPSDPEITADVDVRTLDQKHIVPNMEAPAWRGVWFPRGYAKSN